MYRVLKFNHIAPRGLEVFHPHRYQLTEDPEANPDAILLRSHSLHDGPISNSVQVIARAGAGTNNIPVPFLTARGVPVLNTPGANANAVKELVIAGLLLASRHICQAWHFAKQLEGDRDLLSTRVEQSKQRFSGIELPGRCLGIIGLGNIGVKVANTAISLGMHVVGYDPAISVQNAWQLSAQVERAHRLDEVIKRSDFLTLHVPLTDKTHHLIDARQFALMKKGATLLNFSREDIVDREALLAALNEKHLRVYVTDFIDEKLKTREDVIILPHLGASTVEAEENCAVMAAEQIKAFLETGAIRHAVNFPDCELAMSEYCRLSIANQNVPNMVAQITSVLSQAKINIIDLLNKSREEVAYNLLDLNEVPSDSLMQALGSIPGVLRVRRIQ